MAEKGELDPVVGRDNEIARLVQILSRRKKNNPVLIGEPGTGKTAIVEGLAERIVNGAVPSSIVNKKVLSLDMGSLLAGTMYRGQFEQRIKGILEEIKKQKDIILFIDEIHTVIGTGSAEGSMDAANILKPALGRGEIRLIGATTFDEYKKHIEKDPAFERRFQPVIVNEPSEAETLDILTGIREKYEHHHHVVYTDDALQAAVTLSKRYIQDRFLPDKAIDLIDEAAAATNVITREAAKLSELKKEYGRIMTQKDEAVSGEQYEKATFLRQREITLAAKIARLEETERKNKKTTIDQDDIAAVVSRWTGIPVKNLSVSEKKNFLNLDDRLKKYIVGQDEAIKSITSAIRRSRIGISDPKRPIGSFIFLGPTGVGKTELVKVLAREIFGKEDALIKIDMSEFMEKHNVSRLVGAPAGYVGYEEGGKLTETVRRKPYSVILLDEIEKAHPEVFNILLQIMEDGELTDAKGRRVDFRNTLIVMTSNLGTDLLNKQAKIGFESNSNEKEEFDSEYGKMKNNVLETIEKHFRPEFINRLDQTIVFKPLSKEVIRSIVDIELDKLIDRIKTKNITIKVSKKAKDKIAELGYKPEFGARPMRKVIVDNIENPLTEALMVEEFKSGDIVKIDLLGGKFILSRV
jgi:ATP-dependent Clp protease ATP-binding subunit ClpC